MPPPRRRERSARVPPAPSLATLCHRGRVGREKWPLRSVQNSSTPGSGEHLGWGPSGNSDFLAAALRGL